MRNGIANHYQLGRTLLCLGNLLVVARHPPVHSPVFVERIRLSCNIGRTLNLLLCRYAGFTAEMYVGQRKLPVTTGAQGESSLNLLAMFRIFQHTMHRNTHLLPAFALLFHCPVTHGNHTATVNIAVQDHIQAALFHVINTNIKFQRSIRVERRQVDIASRNKQSRHPVLFKGHQQGIFLNVLVGGFHGDGAIR